MGEAAGCQLPVVPGIKLVGGVAGAPKTPKVLPVKLGPPWLKSMVPLPEHPVSFVAAAQVWLFELTSMLLLGPPTICTVALPLTWKGWGQVGLRTMMGMGAVACTKPQTAEACTSEVGRLLIREAKLSLTRSVISTRRKAVGARAAGGVITPGTEPGKLTDTPLDSLPATNPPPLYPFKAAYWHGAAVGVAEQLKAVPAVKPPI